MTQGGAIGSFGLPIMRWTGRVSVSDKLTNALSKLLSLKLLSLSYRDLNTEAPCTTIFLWAH